MYTSYYITARIIFTCISLNAVHSYDLYHIHIIILLSSYNRYKLKSHLACFQRGFITQLVEHRTGIADVMGSNPVRASDFLGGFICNCFKLLHNYKDHFHLYSLNAVHSYDLYHIHITSLSVYSFLTFLLIAVQQQLPVPWESTRNGKAAGPLTAFIAGFPKTIGTLENSPNAFGFYFGQFRRFLGSPW